MVRSTLIEGTMDAKDIRGYVTDAMGMRHPYRLATLDDVENDT
jgi:hypothetical protein